MSSAARALGLAEVDALLRAEGRYAVGRGMVPAARLLLVLAAAGFAFGAVMGSFGGRPAQALFSALKVPILLVFSTAVCLPNFCAVNAVLGLQDDLRAALRGVLASQTTVAVALCALAPLDLVAYASGVSYRSAVLANGVLFALAALAGQRTLARHYAPLIAANPRHRVARAAWLALYVFVDIQLAWVLRPFVGWPDFRSSFLREDAWSNAYVIVLRDVLGIRW